MAHSSDNPYTLVYNKIWDLIRRNARLMDFISPGNLIDYSDVNTAKDRRSNADTPEIDIRLTGSDGPRRETSSTARVIHVYTITIITDDPRIHDTFHQIKWELDSALLDWDKQLCNLTWKDKTFVKELNIQNADVGLNVGEEQDIRGWAAVTQVSVDMQFIYNDLRACFS